MNRQLQQAWWRRTGEIVLEALRQTPGERPGFLDEACRGDTALRREVESLLSASDATVEGLERSALHWFGSTGEVGARRRIGPYRVVREIGRGGLAVVYLGESREGGERRRVALKVIKPGMDTEAIVRRFRNEGRILRGLEHPNIAQLYGGGSTDDQRPYLAMEYVEGEALDRYCDGRRLGTRQRVELFLKICSAVRYAHRRLVVHRDLKPANILVTEQGEPKLLDFGIAKLLDPATLLPSTATAFGMSLMTPDYASPEQVRSEPVTVASDVYSLGVVLYELLTGRHPYDGWGDGKRWAPGSPALRRMICEVTPRRPSLAARQARPRGSSAAADEPATPRTRNEAGGAERLARSRRLPGDLDRIVMKALRKDPGARYPSVEHLAGDLERHLAGARVRARRLCWGDHGPSLLRRSRAHALLATALALGLGVVMTSIVSSRASRGARQPPPSETLATGERAPRSAGLHAVGRPEPAGPGRTASPATPAAACIPDGGFDDTLRRTDCCSGVAVSGSTVCLEAQDWGTTWESCNQICGTRAIDRCIPPGGIDDTLRVTDCCSGRSVPGSTRCLNPTDYGTSWKTCIQVCA